MIWKFELKITDYQILEVPASSEFLSVGNQNGVLCLWVRFFGDPKGIKEMREIQIVGTGNSDRDLFHKFLGTVIINPFVWHVFEVHAASGVKHAVPTPAVKENDG